MLYCACKGKKLSNEIDLKEIVDCFKIEDIMPENMLGNIEDLMIKGYDGNLCFERDFVGEGLDMISRFSYQ